MILGLWALGGLFMLLDATISVELATSVRRTGGAYAFVTRAFGRFAGLLAGTALWLAYVAAMAFVAVVFAELLHRIGFLPGVSNGLLAVAMIAAIWALQAVGARIGAASLEIGSVVKALVFLALIGALLLLPRDPAAAVPASAMTAAAAGPVTLIGLIAAIRATTGTYYGWEMACYYPEEMTNPARDIPRATFGGIALVTAIYVLMNVAMLAVLSPAQMAGSTLVAADAASLVFGSASALIVTIVSIVSLATINNVFLMTFGRLLYAMSRDAGVPLLSDVSPGGSPRIALAVTAIVAIALASIGVYEILLGAAVLLLVVLYFMNALAAIVLRRREPDLERPYKMPLFPLPALISIGLNGALAVLYFYDDMGLAVKTLGGLVVLAGAAWFATRSSSGVLEQKN